MKTKMRRTLVAIGAAAGMSMAQTVLAEECDMANSLLNQEGALTLNGYYFGQTPANTKALSAPKPTGGGCQGTNSIVITTMAPGSTTDVGDGMVKRKLDAFSADNMIQDPPVTGPTIPALIERFQIIPPVMTNQPVVQRQLTLRDIEFTQTSDGGLGPGHLRFMVYSDNGGQNWRINAHMDYPKYPHDISLDFGDVGLGATDRFDVLVEYKAAGFYPTLKVTFVRPDASYSKQFQLDPMMWPISQSQGLLQQNNMVLNKTFTILNCVGKTCPR
jgi:hypothetical protein